MKADNSIQLSIIIPVLNEEGTIGSLLQHLQLQADHSEVMEILVVDGGSTDDTVKIAKAQGVKVVHSEKGVSCIFYMRIPILLDTSIVPLPQLCQTRSKQVVLGCSLIAPACSYRSFHGLLASIFLYVVEGTSRSLLQKIYSRI